MIQRRGITVTVFVVLHDNYGDQGVDFHGVFGSFKRAQAYISKQEPDKHEQQWWEIHECEPQ
jgi:hypothetical protein